MAGMEIHGIWKFPGQELNSSHSCGNTGSFNPLCWPGKEPTPLQQPGAEVAFLTPLHHSRNSLAYGHCGIWNDWLMGTCCTTQGTLPSILWWSIWRKNLKKNGRVYLYNWFTLLYSRIYHNIVNQLYVNKILNIKKMLFLSTASEEWRDRWSLCLLLRSLLLNST